MAGIWDMWADTLGQSSLDAALAEMTDAMQVYGLDRRVKWWRDHPTIWSRAVGMTPPEASEFFKSLRASGLEVPNARIVKDMFTEMNGSPISEQGKKLLVTVDKIDSEGLYWWSREDVRITGIELYIPKVIP